jgi:hypothetical protein
MVVGLSNKRFTEGILQNFIEIKKGSVKGVILMKCWMILRQRKRVGTHCWTKNEVVHTIFMLPHFVEKMTGFEKNLFYVNLGLTLWDRME